MTLEEQEQGGAQTQNPQLSAAREQWHISTRARARSRVLRAGSVTRWQSQLGSALSTELSSPHPQRHCLALPAVPSSCCRMTWFRIPQHIPHYPGLHYAKYDGTSPSLDGRDLTANLCLYLGITNVHVLP